MRLIEQVWFEQHPAKWLLVPLLLPLSGVFWLMSALRRAWFRYRKDASIKLDCPVVVVGNIGVGGNGKTPVVLFLVEQLQARGIKVGVLSRGYGGQAPSYPYQLTAQSSAVEAGDEPLLIFQRTNAPVVVGSDRIASAKQLIALGCQVIVSDDGLQHYRLQRDYELLVVDGKRLFGNGLLLPAGPLRESTSRLNSVDRVIVNGGHQHQLSNTCVQHPMQLQAKYVVNLLTKEKLVLSEFIASHHKVCAIAGIGDPKRFFNYLQQLGIELDKSQGFIDHQAYNEQMLSALAPADKALLMTEKDAVKCLAFAQPNWWYLPVDAVFSPADSELILADIMQLVDNENKS